MKIARYSAVGIAGSLAFGVIAFALGDNWLATFFVGPGALMAIALGATMDAVVPPPTLGRMMDSLGDGPGAFAGMSVVAAFVIWAVAIGLAYWWIESAPEQ